MGHRTKARQQGDTLELFLLGASMQHLHLVSLCAELQELVQGSSQQRTSWGSNSDRLEEHFGVE